MGKLVTKDMYPPGETERVKVNINSSRPNVVSPKRSESMEENMKQTEYKIQEGNSKQHTWGEKADFASGKPGEKLVVFQESRTLGVQEERS